MIFTCTHSARFHSHTAEGMREAVILLERALAIDPSSALAAAMIGFCRINQMPSGLAPISEAEIAKTLRLAQVGDRSRWR